MGIIYCEKDRTFTLQTKETTYQMQVDQYGFLLHLYYGKKAEGCMDYLLTYYDRGFSGNPYDAGTDRTYSMDSLPQELSCYGNGDFRSASLMLENGDGSMSCDMRYKNYTIRDGKYSLPGLPAVYGIMMRHRLWRSYWRIRLPAWRPCFFTVYFRNWISLQEASISAIRAVRRSM